MSPQLTLFFSKFQIRVEMPSFKNKHLPALHRTRKKILAETHAKKTCPLPPPTPLLPTTNEVEYNT